MESVTVNGVDTRIRGDGSGEPVLLISPVLADGFVPLLSQPALADRHLLIRYHKRGWAGSTHTPPPVSIGDHAADAAALLDHLGIPRAHIAGHSSGAAVAPQLALDRPEMVHTLILMELSLLSVPSGERFLEQAGPAFEAYASGDHARALAMFMTVVSGLDWPTCRALLEERIPGAVTQAVEDADTFFGVELPALTEWEFGPEQAAAIDLPVLSVLGSADRSPCGWRSPTSCAPRSRTSRSSPIDGVGHLLHIQRPEPVARGMAEFLQRNAIAPTRCWSAYDPSAVAQAAASSSRRARRAGAVRRALDAIQERVHRGSSALDPAFEAVATRALVIGSVERLRRATFEHLGLDAAARQRAVREHRGDRGTALGAGHRVAYSSTRSTGSRGVPGQRRRRRCAPRAWPPGARAARGPRAGSGTAPTRVRPRPR